MVGDDELVELLRSELIGDAGGLLAVYRFGSSVRGELRRESDLDLAFLAERSPEPVAVFDAAQSLAVRAGRDVDLVDLARASTVLRAQVVARGSRIHTGDPYRAAEFEMIALSDYARLQEERAGAVAAFERPYRGG